MISFLDNQLAFEGKITVPVNKTAWEFLNFLNKFEKNFDVSLVDYIKFEFILNKQLDFKGKVSVFGSTNTENYWVWKTNWESFYFVLRT